MLAWMLSCQILFFSIQTWTLGIFVCDIVVPYQCCVVFFSLEMFMKECSLIKIHSELLYTITVSNDLIILSESFDVPQTFCSLEYSCVFVSYTHWPNCLFARIRIVMCISVLRSNSNVYYKVFTYLGRAFSTWI